MGTTDFTYNKKAIITSSAIRPSTKNTPTDARTRVKTKADMAEMPLPAVGLIVYVEDEEKFYAIKGLKASAMGFADMLVDMEKVEELVPAGSGEGSGGGEYVTKEELESSLVDLDAATLNGTYFSQPMSREKYDSIEVKNENIIYIVNDDSSSGAGLTTEQLAKLNSAYEHSQSTHVQISDIPTKTSQLTNDSGFITKANSDYILTSPSGKKFKLIVNDNGDLSTETVINRGNLIVNLTDITVNENTSKEFTISLDSAPTESQVVSIVVDNSNVTLSPESVIFTSSNYNEAKTITVTATHDPSSYVDLNSVITISSDSVESKTVNVVIKNIDINNNLLQDSLLSSYKAVNATSSLIPDSTGDNDITLAGTPTIEDGYVVFEGTDGKGTATLSGFTNNGEGDWTIQICVNLSSAINGTLIKAGSYQAISAMGDESVNWNNILRTNIATTEFDYHTMAINEILPKNTDFVVSVVKSGTSYEVYYDGVQKNTRAITGAIMKSYSELSILETTEAYIRKFKSLAIYNKALSEDEIIGNIDVLKS